MKKIKVAEKKGELDLFLMGIGKYQINGQSDLPMPNNYNECWRQEIIPFSKINGALPKKLVTSLSNLLEYKEDFNLALYTILMTINWYYFFKEQGAINYELDLRGLVKPFKNRICAQKNSLINDKRWAGNEWNSDCGLWGPFLQTIKFIKNRYKGIDLLPQC